MLASRAPMPEAPDFGLGPALTHLPRVMREHN